MTETLASQLSDHLQHDHMPEPANSRAIMGKFITALCGDDPDMPAEIWPIGWLDTMIEECKCHARDADGIEDIDAHYEMIREVECLRDKCRAALAEAR